MNKWQKESIESYEQITAFEFTGKDRIHDDESFWVCWDHNLGWFESVFADVQNIINPYSHLRDQNSSVNLRRTKT